MSYPLIKDLIVLAEEFEKGRKSRHAPDVSEFAVWLSGRVQNIKTIYEERLGGEYDRENGRAEDIDTTISRMVVYMYKYARFYGKKALEYSRLQTLDEFSYLATLISEKSLNKSELISRNIHEKPTGMDIIKRLLQYGFVAQADDDTDKRSKQISITEAGKAELRNVFVEMGKVSRIVSGDLTEVEKVQLALMLKRLDIYHHKIFVSEKNQSLDEIIKNNSAEH